MLLFFTRDARCSLSIEVRRVGEGEESLPLKMAFSELNLLGVAGSRPCQKSRGDESPIEALKGEDWNGEESRLIFCFEGQHWCLGGVCRLGMWLTLLGT